LVDLIFVFLYALSLWILIALIGTNIYRIVCFQYRGYKDIKKQYVAVKVVRCYDYPGEDMIEVHEDFRPKVNIIPK